MHLVILSILSIPRIWGQHHKYPRFKKELEFEDIRAELEDMLLQFITDYRLANPKSSEREGQN